MSENVLSSTTHLLLTQEQLNEAYVKAHAVPPTPEALHAASQVHGSMSPAYVGFLLDWAADRIEALEKTASELKPEVEKALSAATIERKKYAMLFWNAVQVIGLCKAKITTKGHMAINWIAVDDVRNRLMAAAMELDPSSTEQGGCPVETLPFDERKKLAGLCLEARRSLIEYGFPDEPDISYLLTNRLLQTARELDPPSTGQGRCPAETPPPEMTAEERQRFTNDLQEAARNYRPVILPAQMEHVPAFDERKLIAPLEKTVWLLGRVADEGESMFVKHQYIRAKARLFAEELVSAWREARGIPDVPWAIDGLSITTETAKQSPAPNVLGSNVTQLTPALSFPADQPDDGMAQIRDMVYDAFNLPQEVRDAVNAYHAARISNASKPPALTAADVYQMIATLEAHGVPSGGNPHSDLPLSAQEGDSEVKALAEAAEPEKKIEFRKWL